ncbi:MAG: hypothetical protein K2O00_03985 [Muribaculaceae bacterium]|nr:hypothetical protein [Muribaculaceae bacterium]
MKPLLTALLLPLLLQATAVAQRTTRTRLRPRHQIEVQVADTPIYIVPAPETCPITGFDKPLNSLRETFHLTNNTPATVTELFLTLNYTDTSGRQLHRLSRHITHTIEPGETVLLSIPSFDRQKSFYYRLSRKPRVQSTPFDVTIQIDSVRIMQ